MAQHDPDFVYVTYIRTTPEKLWEALTNAEFTRRYWFGMTIASDWKVGSPVSYASSDGTVKVRGKVLAVERPKRLEYTFHEQFGKSLDEPPTRVVMEIEPEQGTETVCLKVTHTDFVENSTHRVNVSGGWAAVLSTLKSMLETGKPLEFEG